ncbi:MAG: SPW repeat protein [Candidatus Liptonbacteria bacterium]|nr:SPW repeat protein [Candidatus Liptonbacteria bacterium]
MTRNYVQLAIGIWILISPWLLGFYNISIMMWSNLIAGIILILVNVWAIFGEPKNNPQGGGIPE